MEFVGKFWRTAQTSHFHRHPVLGTEASGQIVVTPPRYRSSRTSSDAERLLFDTITTLEQVFSAYLPDSEFARWRRGDTNTVSAPLGTVFARAQHWLELSQGAFNPFVGLATELWAIAHIRQSLPSADELVSVARQIAASTAEVFHPPVNQSTNRRMLNLNAIAKGHIADQAARRVLEHSDVESIVLNLGGDLIHLGSGSTSVVIHNPLRAYDNEPPLFTLGIANAAIATSGSASRGWSIGDHWYSHVIDPRSARPVSTIASATAVATNGMDADAIATVFSVLQEDERKQFVAKLDPAVAYCIVHDDSSVVTNQTWDDLCT